jgi:exopolysaccharide biosynthesis polyprenyl glycosylphosphotransferase
MAVHRSHLDTQIVWMAALDAVCLVVAVAGAIVVRLGTDALAPYLFGNASGWVYLGATIIVSNYVTGTYGLEIRVSRFNMLVNWFFSIGMALLVVSATSYAWLGVLVGRGVLALTLVFYSILWLSLRLVTYHFLFRKDAFGYRVAVVGAGPRARQVLEMVENAGIRPVHRVAVLIDVRPGGAPPAPVRKVGGVPVIPASAATLAPVIRSLAVDVILIGLEREDEAAGLYPQLRRLRFEGVPVLTALNVAEVYSGRVPLDLIDEAWLMQVSLGFASTVVMRFKRVFDVLFVLLFSVPAVIVCALIALWIKAASPRSPVFYSQDRVGRFGGRFRIHKFRTMVSGAEQGVGAVWSPPQDPRVTATGRVLRRYRLDELPQLLNVLEGDMSLVGPRPERPELGARLEREIPYYRERENIPPGLTGWAQIRHPYGASVEDARIKLEYDLYYLQNLSVGLDLRIILRTLRIVLFGLEREMR